MFIIWEVYLMEYRKNRLFLKYNFQFDLANLESIQELLRKVDFKSLFFCVVNSLKCFWKRDVKVNSYAINLYPVCQTEPPRFQKRVLLQMQFWPLHGRFLLGVHSGIFLARRLLA